MVNEDVGVNLQLLPNTYPLEHASRTYILIVFVADKSLKFLQLLLVAIFGLSNTFFAKTEKNFAASSLLMVLFALNVVVLVYFVRPLL